MFLLVLTLLVCPGWPSVNASWLFIATFAVTKVVLGGLGVWELVKLVRNRKQLAAIQIENPR